MNVEVPLCERLWLNPISPAASSLYIKKGLRDQWSFAIDFLTPSFRQSLWASLFSPICRYENISHWPSASPHSPPLLPLLHSHFCFSCNFATRHWHVLYIYHRAEQTIQHFRKLPPLPLPTSPVNPWETLIHSLPSAEVDSNIWRYVSLQVPSLLRSLGFPASPLSDGARSLSLTLCLSLSLCPCLSLSLSYSLWDGYDMHIEIHHNGPQVVTLGRH